MVGRLDDAAAQVADGTQHARRERNAMALEAWATIEGLSTWRRAVICCARRDRIPAAPAGQRDPLDMIRIFILAQVAAHTVAKVVAADGQ